MRQFIINAIIQNQKIINYFLQKKSLCAEVAPFIPKWLFQPLQHNYNNEINDNYEFILTETKELLNNNDYDNFT